MTPERVDLLKRLAGVWAVVAAALVAFALMAPAAARAAAPANDNFADAAPIGAGASVQGTNVDATKEPGEPDHAGDPGGHSIWYVWTAPTSGTFRATGFLDDSSGACNNELVAVYTGSAVSALTAVNANAVSVCSAPTAVGLKAAAGITYHFAIDGSSGLVGDTFFELEQVNPPPNDDFANAQALSGLSDSTSTTTRDATNELGEPHHAGLDLVFASVWFRWTAPTSGPVRVDVCQGLGDSLFGSPLVVYTGTGVGALTPVAGALVGGLGDPCSVSFTATGGTTYHIAFATEAYGEQSPVVRLQVLERPANDDFAHAQPLSGAVADAGPVATDLASLEPGEPQIAGVAGGHSIWYSWTAPSTGVVAIDTCTSDFDTLLAAYTGSSLASLRTVASDEAAQFGNCPSETLGQSAIRFQATAGTSYRIAVDGANGAVGDARLHLEMADALPLHCGSLLVHSVTLHTDLTRCPGDGLVIAADNVTLNLNGFTIRQAVVGEESTGVNDTGGFNHLMVTGNHGGIEDFLLGVLARGNDVAITQAKISAPTRGRSRGIVIQGGANAVIRSNTLAAEVLLSDLRGGEVADNTISGGGLAPPLLEIDRSSGVTVKHNHLTDFNHFNIMINDSHDIAVSSNTIINGNVSAVWLLSSDHNMIDHNVITMGADNTGSDAGSIALEGSDYNQVIANALTRTGGIVVGTPRATEPEQDPGHVSDRNTIRDNRLSRGSDGVWIRANEATRTLLLRNISAHNSGDGFAIDSPSTLVDSNIALGNAGHGFNAVPGASSGINIALKNKTPPECINVRCVPRN
jgi:hypothetical protein